MATTDTLNASDFKARCLDLLDQVYEGRIDRLVITKRGRPVAVLVPPPADPAAIAAAYGSMRGTVVIPAGVDLTEPVLNEPLDADLGLLHR